MIRIPLTAALAGLALSLPATAQIVGETFEYTVGDTVFEGYVARNAGLEDPRGTVLIVHDWSGMDAYEQRRAEMLAAQGYVAVALDVYGRDAVTESMQDFQRLSGALYADRETFRARLLGGIEAAADLPGVDDDMVLIGYCFGGAAVLEAARAGADVEGFVSFHGGLGTPEGQDWAMASDDAPILFLHGSADPVSGMADLAAQLDELQAAGIPHAAEIFGGARHSFTVWGSRDCDLGADTGSWNHLLRFLDQTL